MGLIVKNHILSFRTEKGIELIDITEKVEELVKSSGVKEGMCIVSAPHATASIVLNENETGLIEDLKELIEELFPRNGKYRHNLIDDNASAHLASSFLGSSKVIPISGGKLLRGTWQNILFLELDGPRSRREAVITIMGVNDDRENE
ncbi:MAG: secondary thiamine-phosphate synthase enzyme YjbQ [Fervidicoccaceae archaeon]